MQALSKATLRDVQSDMYDQCACHQPDIGAAASAAAAAYAAYHYWQ